MMKRRAWLMAAAALWAAGCDGPEERRPGAGTAAVRDSAGVRIVDFPAIGVDTTRVDAPLLTVGHEGDPAYEFDAIRFVGSLGDGRIVVVDQGAPGVRFFAPDGTHLATVGRSGQGPGEFGFVSSAQLLASDTLVVNDTRARRVSFVGPDMRFARSVSYVSTTGEPDPDGDLCTFPGWIGVVSAPPRTHALRSWGCIHGRGVEGWVPFEYSVALWDPETDEDGPVFSATLGEAWEWPTREGMERFVMTPFMAGALPVASEDGILVSSPDHHRIRRFTSDGAFVLEIREAAARRATTEAHREAWRADRTEEELTGYRDVPFPDSLPVFFQAQTDGRRIWALHYDIPGSTGQNWRVYEEGGTRRRVLAFPPGFELFSVRDDRAYGVYTDGLGIERPRIYRLPE